MYCGIDFYSKLIFIIKGRRRNLTKTAEKKVRNLKKPEKKTELKQIDFTLVITVLILLGLGIVMVLSASSPSAYSTTGSSYTYAIRQIQFAILGIVAMIIISRIDYHKYHKVYKLAYVVGIILLLLVMVPGLKYSAKGATRWIDLGFTTVQPSETMKICLIVFYAGYLTLHKDDMKSFWKGFVKPLAFLVPVALIMILVQDHLSGTIIMVLVSAVMILLAGSKLRYFLTVGSLAGVGGIAGLFILAKTTGQGAFRIDRLVSFLDPWKYAQDEGWQVIQSLYAIGSGGLFGAGLGESKQKYLYISEPHNDFIFAVLAEELGFVGCAIVIALFVVFIWRGVLIAMKAPDMFGSLLASGITVLIGLQAIINIAVVTSSIPVTGMPLPFFSYGGSALVILLCSVGVLLNISRHSTKL